MSVVDLLKQLFRREDRSLDERHPERVLVRDTQDALRRELDRLTRLRLEADVYERRREDDGPC